MTLNQRSTRIRTVYPITAGIGMLLLLIVGESAAQETVTFGFDPPNGVAFIETKRITKTFAFADPSEAAQTVQTDQTQLRYTVDKTAEGFAVVIRPIAPEEKLSDDLAKVTANLMHNMVITYVLDQNGQLIRIRGAEQAMEKLRDSLPPELMELVQQMMPQSLEQQMAYEWRMRSVLGMHVGNTMTLDTDYELAGQLPTPTGSGMPIEGAIRAALANECPTENCVDVSYGYESDNQALGQQMSDAFRQAFSGMVGMLPPDEAAEIIPQLPTIVVQDVIIKETGSRRLDSVTGLIYGDSSERDMYATIIIEDVGQKRLKITERQVYTYDYQ